MGIISCEDFAAQEIMKMKIPRPRLGEAFNARMPGGVYNLDEDFQLGDFIPTSNTLQQTSDDIYVFRDEGSRQLREEIERFWQPGTALQLEKVGLNHRRGIILFGKPGSGKSSLIKVEMKKLAEEKNHVIFLSKSPWYLQRMLHQFRGKEPNRPVTVVIEDIDEVCGGFGEYQFLELLDGPESINHVLYIATTNNLERLSEKLRRPGRFDRKIPIPNPASDLRRVYLEKKFGSKLPKNKIEEIVKVTEGLSFGHLREIVVSHCGYNQPLHETIDRVRKDVLLETQSSNGPSLMEYMKTPGF